MKTDKMWIIDSKQIGKSKTFEAGAIKVIENAVKDTRQLSEAWINAVADKLPKKERNLIKDALTEQKIKTAVIGVNKETGNILFLPLEIENKRR